MKSITSLGLILLVLCVSNPGPKAHDRAMHESFKRSSPIQNFLGLYSLARRGIVYETYGVASVSRCGNDVCAVGLLGQVFTADEIATLLDAR